MSDTIRYTLTRKITDDDGLESMTNTWTVTHTITEKQTGTMTIATGAGYIAVTFAQIASANVVVLRTDQELTIKLNGGTEEFVLSSDLLFAGTITGIQVKNESGTDASLEYEIMA